MITSLQVFAALVPELTVGFLFPTFTMKKKKAPLGLKFVFKSEKPAGNASEAATQKQILERRIFESVLIQFNSTFSKGGWR